jgi:hypothetical protein
MEEPCIVAGGYGFESRLSFGQPLGVSGNKYHLGIASLIDHGDAGSNPAAAAKKSLHRRQSRNTETTAGGIKISGLKNNFKKILKKVLHFVEKYLIL